ncbi:MAG: hypothetical protein ABIT37_04115 [Luteolibacter sp.]
MKNLLCLILLSLMALLSPAAEIVSWKVPLSGFVEKGLDAQGIVRRKSAPEVSPFFKEGDELWDLKGAAPDVAEKRDFSLDWLVWNATSGRLVAKGNWIDLSAIHEILRLDRLAKQARINLSAYEVPSDGAPPSEDAKPVATVSLLTRSGMKSEATWSEGGKSISLQTAVSLAETNPIADIQFHCSVGVPDQPGIEVTSVILLRSESPLWIARDFDGKKGLDLKLDYSTESIGSTPLHGQVMIIRDNKPVSLMPNWKLPENHRVADGWAVISPLALDDFLEKPSDGKGSPEIDPFAEAAPRERAPFRQARTANPPDSLRPWLEHEVLDATEWLKKNGLTVEGERFFAGYDPIQQRFYFQSTNEKLAGDVEILLSPGCYLRPGSVITTLDGIGQMRLVARSGMKASLVRMLGEKSTRRSLEIEPTIGENGDLMDMRLKFEDQTDPQKITRLDTSTTLTTGKPQELLSGSESGGGKSSLRIKGEVYRLPLD